MTLATTALASFISCSDLSYINSNLLFLDDLYLESDGNTWFSMGQGDHQRGAYRSNTPLPTGSSVFWSGRVYWNGMPRIAT